MNILTLFIISLLLTSVACSSTSSVYKDIPSSSSSASGYHRNEYNHRYGNAPPVPDQNQLPQK